MRFIPVKELLRSRVPDEWTGRARAAAEGLEKSGEDERSTYISANSGLWGELKSTLAAMSYGKCWFSEADIALAELHIDHFRPKGAVHGARRTHRGYWWLAFEPENFRLASSLVNRRLSDERNGDVQGKGAYFPLLNEDERVYHDAPPPRDCSAERPVLIDPTIARDVALLDYSPELGKVVEALPKGSGQGYSRADASIKFYHLNDGTLIRDRLGLEEMMSILGDRLDLLEDAAASRALSPGEQARYDGAFQRLAVYIHPNSPFSSFAAACVKQRSRSGWALQLLAG